MDNLKEDESVYKLFGRILVKQDPNESKGTVASRLKFIQTELQRTEASLTDAEKKREGVKTRIIEMQKKIAMEKGANIPIPTE